MKNLVALLFVTASLFFASRSYSQQPQLVLADTDVKDIFNLIFDNKKANSLRIIIKEDRRKAVFFMRELIDKSCDVGIVQDIFRASYKLKPNLKKMVKVLIKNAIVDCNRDEYYLMVQVKIAQNFKSAYDIRLQTGEW